VCREVSSSSLERSRCRRHARRRCCQQSTNERRLFITLSDTRASRRDAAEICRESVGLDEFERVVSLV